VTLVPPPEGVNVDEELTANLENGVLWLTINRADKGNAIPYYARDRLTQWFQEAHSDLAVRSIVLTGAGERHFCTGADLSIRQPAKPKPEGAPDMVVGMAVQMMRAGFQRLMQAMLDCEKPVIVALNGTAAGGGSMFVLAADLVIAADTAKIIQVFVRRGLVPDGGVAYLLPRIVGMHKAKELIFFGDDLSAADAERIGLVNKVVPGDQLLDEAQAWAARLANGPTKAIGLAKWLVNRSLDSDRKGAFEDEAHAQELASRTEDFQEGVQAFIERREVQFKGW
jgi:2-(1,2-epoxy-1,2-dihydrophenyl)acetyl-CoA isomerase